MLENNKKISIRQAALLFLVVTFTPSIRVIPAYAAERAKQAAWLSPLITVLVFMAIVFLWHKLYEKYNNHTSMDIYSNITGRIAGKIIAVIHLLWLVILTALYIRYFAIRLVSSIYPNVSENIFIVSLLVVIAYTLRSGLIPLARFNEVIFAILTGTFFILVLLALSNFKFEFLCPITYRDILPIFKASGGSMGILAYFSFFFIIGDRINNQESIKRIALPLSLFLLVFIIANIGIAIGTFGYSLVQRFPLPFLMSVKQISLFNTLEKIESLVIAFWVFSDFVLISSFIILALHILKYLLNLADVKPFLNIYIVFLYTISLIITGSAFELQKLSDSIIIPFNIALGVILPAVIFCIGKIRKKV